MSTFAIGRGMCTEWTGLRMAARSQRARPKLREGVRNPCMLFSSPGCQAICECGLTVDSRNRQLMRRLDILEQDICVHRLRACAPGGFICSAPAPTVVEKGEYTLWKPVLSFFLIVAVVHNHHTTAQPCKSHDPPVCYRKDVRHSHDPFTLTSVSRVLKGS